MVLPTVGKTAGFGFSPEGETGWGEGKNRERKIVYSFSSLAFVPLPFEKSKVKGE